MAIRQVNPYLSFDVPNMQVAPGNQDRMMHAVLRLGAGIVMVSDCDTKKS